MLCAQLSGQRFGIAKAKDHFHLYGVSIPPAELIDEKSVAVTRLATATDGVLDYYLHTPAGAVTVSGGGFGEQEIQASAIPGSDQDYFNTMVRKLDSIIDLDFRQVDNTSSSDVDLYYDTEIDLGAVGVSLGLATTSGTSGWELYLNYPALANDEPHRRYALLHEFGHSLGLEHPFEASDGDVFGGNSDPWTSAYPASTVMAYRSPKSGLWPNFFSDSDLNALINIWGAETQIFTRQSDSVAGANYRDVFLGAGGADELRGAGGDDRIEGGRGHDQVMGGKGADCLFGGAGNDSIFGGYGHDTISSGRGDDQIRGGYGDDVFILSAGDDVIEDFRLSENDRLSIAADIEYELLQYDQDVVVSTSAGITTLWNVNYDNFLAEGRFVIS